jgi:hypothetical protein
MSETEQTQGVTHQADEALSRDIGNYPKPPAVEETETAPPITEYRGRTRHEGITRLGFFLAFLGVCLLVALLGAAGIPEGGLIVATFILLPLAASRYINMGKSPWWCLLVLIPVISILVFIDCFTTPTEGADWIKCSKGGFFSDGSAVPLYCRKASIHIDRRCLRIEYLPKKSLNKASKVEFSLDEENLLVDKKSRIIGVRKIKNGNPVFLGCMVSNEILSLINDKIQYTDADLRRERG